MRFYSDDWPPHIEGYVMNTLRRDYWRVRRTMEWDDAVQEAREVYVRCLRHYPDVNAPHFMSLFSSAWKNRMHRLAELDTRDRANQYVGVEDDEGPSTLERVGESDNDGYLAVLLRQAPREVLMVLSLFLNAPQEAVDEALGHWSHKADPRTQGLGIRNQARLNRLLGLPPDRNTIAEVREYLGG